MTTPQYPVKAGSTAPLKNVAACLDVANRIIARPPGVDGLGVFFGPSGYGKTKGSLFVQQKKNALYLEVFDFWTRKVFVQMLLAELEVPNPRGSIGDMMQQAIRLLKDEPNRLLVIDEADKLVDKNMIELVRDIYKGAKIPVLLVGEERLPEKLARYERCENRVSAFGMANPCDVDDARVLGQLYQPGIQIAEDLLAHIVDETKGVASRIVASLAEVGQFCAVHGLKSIDKAGYSGAIFTGLGTAEAPLMSTILRLKIDKARPVLRGHDHFRNVIRRLGEDGQTFTANQVSKDCQPGVEADIRDFIRRLMKAGIAERVEGEKGGRVRLIERPRATPRLKRDGSVCPQSIGRQQMWNVMRRQVGGFTAQDLAIGGSTDEIKVTERAADYFSRALADAGILVAIVKRKPGVPAAWRLTGTGNTGPRAPKVMRTRLIWDANLETVIGDAEAEEEVLP